MNYTVSISEAPYPFDMIQVGMPIPTPMMCDECLLVFDHSHKKDSTVYSMKLPRKKIGYNERGVKSFNHHCCPNCGSEDIFFL